MNWMSSRLRIGVVLIALAVSTHVHAQAVVNTLSKRLPSTPVAKPKPVALTEYNPKTPPAANVPTVVSEKQDEIAASLAVLPGETNDQYTKRMKVRYDAATKELERISAEHQARMKALVRP